MRFPLALLLLLVCLRGLAQDTDHDGLSDSFEDALLQRFEPQFHVSRTDCSRVPALFQPGIAVPTVQADDGTIYGQVFPRSTGAIELHFYHLWRRDCGEMGHALDTEHVAALLVGSGTDAAEWKAVYWYAAAHENTVCDAGQISRASTLQAEDHGAKVWISAGKHASYLSEKLCNYGCGGDRCEGMQPLKIARVVNLGEADAPANGSVWIRSSNWPLLEKMTRSDFRPALIDRVNKLPQTDIAWAEPAKRPTQAAILGGNRGVDGALIGATAGGRGIATGGRSTNTAISVAAGKTGNAFSRSVHAVGHALGTSASKTGQAIGVKAKE